MDQMSDKEILEILAREPDRPCVFCGTSIDPTSGTRRLYCSDPCRWTARNTTIDRALVRKYKRDQRERQRQSQEGVQFVFARHFPVVWIIIWILPVMRVEFLRSARQGVA
jgi:predicted nucleic acid-binding Zn ribbon protein